MEEGKTRVPAAQTLGRPWPEERRERQVRVEQAEGAVWISPKSRAGTEGFQQGKARQEHTARSLYPTLSPCQLPPGGAKRPLREDVGPSSEAGTPSGPDPGLCWWAGMERSTPLTFPDPHPSLGPPLPSATGPGWRRPWPFLASAVPVGTSSCGWRSTQRCSKGCSPRLTSWKSHSSNMRYSPGSLAPPPHLAPACLWSAAVTQFSNLTTVLPGGGE